MLSKCFQVPVPVVLKSFTVSARGWRPPVLVGKPEEKPACPANMMMMIIIIMIIILLLIVVVVVFVF